MSSFGVGVRRPAGVGRRPKVVFVVGSSETDRVRYAGRLRSTADLAQLRATLAETDAAFIADSAGVAVLVADVTPTTLLVSALCEFRECAPSDPLLTTSLTSQDNSY
jgi:hypothetical protein